MEALGSASSSIYRNGLYSRAYDSNFFRDAPYDASITLQDFETICLERLKLLRLFESIAFKVGKYSPEYVELINKEISRELRDRYIKPHNPHMDPNILSENRRRDIVSHFALRLVFCRNEDQKRWFITHETDLFFSRLSNENGSELAGFLRDSGLNYSPLPEEEYRNLKEILQRSTFIRHEGNDLNYPEAEFYKMDFLEALEQVRRRRVYLSQGWAYIPRKQLIEVVAARFRENLSMELAKLSRVMAESQEETRLIPLLNKLACGYTGKDFSVSDTDYGINLGTLDTVAAESFPMCARNMHDHLRKDHHLKHDARLQYGLFIKGIGVNLEDNLKLMRSEFSKFGMNEAKFNKEHAYNYRHMYGKEGKRTNYTPYSCLKIITGKAPTGQDEHHGCPFKHFNRNLLQTRMKMYGVGEEASQEILQLVAKGHFQIACTKYFEVTHRDKLKAQPLVEAISHPNQYVEESRKLLHPELVKEKPAVFKPGAAPEPGGPLPAQPVYQPPSAPASDPWDEELSQEDLDAFDAAMEVDQPGA